MGLTFAPIKEIAKIVKHYRLESDGISEWEKKVLCFSYPDLIISATTATELFNRKNWKFRKDSKDIIEWHKCHNITNQIIDTTDFFERIGFIPVYADLTKARANEVIVDLNITLERIDLFDLVIDNIMHHCFNIGTALLNIINHVVEGGFVLHVNPLTMINHAFYNISPQFYHSFYRPDISGFELISHKIVSSKGKTSNDYMLEKYKRMRGIPDDFVNIVVAKRIKNTEIVWPIQEKFIKYPDSKR
jgi:hypothetical protein